jgi:hypothetical protein
MVKRILIVLILLAAAGGLILAYVQMSKERQREAGADKPVVPESTVKSGPDGEHVLVLDQAAQTRLGLKIESIGAIARTPEAKGFGRILDSAPLAALATELASDEAALTASQKEFDRLKVLSTDQNASARALQAAEATARHDQIALESVRSRLLSGWGKTIAEQKDLAGFAKSLVALESAIVRVDLPASEALNGVEILAHGARIEIESARNTSFGAQWLGPAPNVDPQIQGKAFLFLATAGAGNLLPGMAVSAYLPLQAGPLNGFVVPDSAVVRQGGHAWVYVQKANDNFTRRKISLDSPLDRGWFITNGVSASDRIVVQGAQVLLSEEFKYQIRMLD